MLFPTSLWESEDDDTDVGGGMGNPIRLEYSYGNHWFHDSFTMARARMGRTISSVMVGVNAGMSMWLLAVENDDGDETSLSMIAISS